MSHMWCQRDISSSAFASLFAESSQSSSSKLVGRSGPYSFCCADAPRHRAVSPKVQRKSSAIFPSFRTESHGNSAKIPGVFDPKPSLIMRALISLGVPPNCRTVSRGTRPSVSPSPTKPRTAPTSQSPRCAEGGPVSSPAYCRRTHRHVEPRHHMATVPAMLCSGRSAMIAALSAATSSARVENFSSVIDATSPHHVLVGRWR